MYVKTRACSGKGRKTGYYGFSGIYDGLIGIMDHGDELTLYLICKFWALLIQQQLKIRCQKYGQMGYNYLIE